MSAPCQVSWREDVLRAAPPGPVKTPAAQLGGLLCALCWTPDARLLMALDRLGSLCALDCSGALQHLILTAPSAQVRQRHLKTHRSARKTFQT